MIRLKNKGHSRLCAILQSPTCAGLLAIWLGASVALAQEELDSNKAVPPKNVTLKFVDEEDQPIEGVSFTTGGLVYVGNSEMSIGESLEAKNGGELVSAADGTIECLVPDMGLGDLARMSLDATHDEFVAYAHIISLSDGVTEVVLQRGVQIAVTAVDSESKQAITENLFGIAGQNSGKQLCDWKPMKNGMLISPALPQEAHRIRLVHMIDGMATRFSNPIDVQQPDGGRVMLKEIPMFPALKLKGKLSPKVPRPIKNGQISICVAWNEEKDLRLGDPVGHWFDRVAVDEDGQFEITGIPSGDWLQLVATCDGWYSEASPENLRWAVYPALDMRIDATILPLILNLKESHKALVVEMAPRKTVELEVLDEAGKPLKGVEVLVSDYAFISNGTWGRITREELAASRAKQTLEFEYQEPTHEFTTDKNGKVSISDFPGDKLLVRVLRYDVVSTIPQKGLNDNKKTLKVKPRTEGQPFGPPQ